MLVSTVTPMTSGRGRPSRSAASAAAVAAACIIGTPPDAWTFIIQAPVARAGFNRLRHGVGDVVELQIQEHPRALVGQRADEATGPPW